MLKLNNRSCSNCTAWYVRKIQKLIPFSKLFRVIFHNYNPFLFFSFITSIFKGLLIYNDKLKMLVYLTFVGEETAADVKWFLKAWSLGLKGMSFKVNPMSKFSSGFPSHSEIFHISQYGLHLDPGYHSDLISHSFLKIF